MAKRSPISATGEHLFVYFVSALLNGRVLLTVSALNRWNLETFPLRLKLVTLIKLRPLRQRLKLIIVMPLSTNWMTSQCHICDFCVRRVTSGFHICIFTSEHTVEKSHFCVPVCNKRYTTK